MNLHPTMAQALHGFMPPAKIITAYAQAMRTVDANRPIKIIAQSASPTADAEDYFDGLSDTYTTEVDFLGMKLTAEINRIGDRLVDVLGKDGTCWYELLSGKALRQIRNMALEAAQ